MARRNRKSKATLSEEFLSGLAQEFISIGKFVAKECASFGDHAARELGSFMIEPPKNKKRK